jgi:hypothetical protein
MIENPTDTDKLAFDLSPKQDVFYILNDVVVKQEGNAAKGKAAKVKVSQANAGGLIPAEQWDTNFTSLQWIVRWQTNKGMQPCRPQITWTGPDVEIRGSAALPLTSQSEVPPT